MRYLTPPFPYTPSKCNGLHISHSIVRSGTTDFAIAWAHRFKLNKTAVLSEVRISTFSVSNSRKASTLGALLLDNAIISSMHITSSTEGGYTLVWEEVAFVALRKKQINIRAATLGSAGNLLLPIVTIRWDINHQGLGAAWPRVASLARGGFVIVWNEVFKIAAQIYRNLSNKKDKIISKEVALGIKRYASTHVHSADVAALKDGGFAVIWTRGRSSIGFKMFEPDGQNRTNLIRVGSTAARSSFTSLSSGNLVIAWESQFGLDMRYIEFQIFLPNGVSNAQAIVALRNVKITGVIVAALGQTGFVVYVNTAGIQDKVLTYDLYGNKLSDTMDMFKPGINLAIAGVGNGPDFVVVGSNSISNANATNLVALKISPTDPGHIDVCERDELNLVPTTKRGVCSTNDCKLVQYLKPPFSYIPSKCNGSNVSPSVARLGSDSFGIAWAHRFNPDEITEIRISTFSARNSKHAKNLGIILLDPPTNHIYSTCITGLTEGGYAVVWEEYPKAGGGPMGRVHVKAALVGSGGDLLQPIIEVALWVEIRKQGEAIPRCASLAKGGFIVVWNTNPSGLLSSIMAKIYQIGATNNYTETFNRNIVSGNVRYADVAIIKDGGFIVMWVHDGFGIEFKIFAPDGKTQTHSIGVGGSYTIRGSIVSLDSGDFVIAWKSKLGALSNLYDAKFQIFLANGSASISPKVASHGAEINTVIVADLNQAGFILYIDNVGTIPDKISAYDLNGYELSQSMDIVQPGTDVAIAGVGYGFDFVIAGGNRDYDTYEDILAFKISTQNHWLIDPPSGPIDVCQKKDIHDESSLGAAVGISILIGLGVLGATIITSHYSSKVLFRTTHHEDQSSFDPPYPHVWEMH